MSTLDVQHKHDVQEEQQEETLQTPAIEQDDVDTLDTLDADDETLTDADKTVDDEEGTELEKLMANAMTVGGNIELVMLGEPHSNKTEALVVRGTYGSEEGYWYHIDGTKVDAKFLADVMQANGLSVEAVKKENGMSRLLANMASAAASSIVNIEGVELVKASFGPVGHIMYEFTQYTPIQAIEEVYIKRASTTAYRYRRVVQARKAAEAKAAEEAAKAAGEGAGDTAAAAENGAGAGGNRNNNGRSNNKKQYHQKRQERVVGDDMMDIGTY